MCNVNKNNILLICNSFPPNPGIGGRRWAKFAKYLSRKGYKIFVLTADPEGKKESNWYDDIKNNTNIEIRYYKNPYPKALNKIPYTFLDKLNYKVQLKKLKWITRGDYFDRGVLLKSKLIKLSKEIIKKKGISKLIVTGAPNHLLVHARHLKNIFPDIKLIGDIRDPWTIQNEEWSFGSLNKKRKNEEKEYEHKVVKDFDKIISVYPEMTEFYQKTFPSLNNKFHTLPNGYDKEDIHANINNKNKGKDEVKFVYTGSLYSMLDHLFNPFFKTLSELKKEDKGTYNRLRFDFYGKQPEHIKKLKKQFDLERVNFYNEITLKESMKKIAEADMCMLFLMKNYEFTLNTKFYEYIAHGKKIILFSEEGRAAEFILKNDLGFHISTNNMKSDLKNLIKQVDKGVLEKPIKFDLSKVNVEYYTNQLIKIIE